MTSPAEASTTLEPLVYDLVEWVAREPRAYRDVLEAWRTSCPRLTVWEDAEERRLVTRLQVAGAGTMISATPVGLQFLKEHGR